ncbi:MAG: hypothetical protein JW943_00370 [Deltaproteobacteria bacterium]|nr:hypothetical protein [Deltaproteobacteria bacterium]
MKKLILICCSILLLAGLLFVSNQVACAGQKQPPDEAAENKLKNYPTTPAKVVEAFLNLKLKYVVYDVYKKGNPKDDLRFIEKLSAYTNIHIDPELYCGAGVKTVSSYKILGTKVVGEKAEVSVEHNFCGGCANDLSCGIEKERVVSPYKLLKNGDRWIIDLSADDCDIPCRCIESVKETIRRTETMIKNPDKFKWLGNEPKENLMQLKKCVEGVK